MNAMGATTSGRGTAVAIAAAVTVTLTSVGVSLWATVVDRRALSAAVLGASFAVVAAAVGAVVAAARPGNRVGWAMLAGAAMSALGGCGADLAYHGIVSRPGAVPGV